MARQSTIPGTERPRIPELDQAAEHLHSVTAEFDRVKTQKEAATDSLIAAMKKHGVMEYRDEESVPPLRVTLKPGPDRVKVKEVRHAGRPDDAAQAEADRILEANGSAELVDPHLQGEASRHRKAKTRTAREVGAVED